MHKKQLGFCSKLVHAGAAEDAHGSAVTPIYQTSTFRFDSAQDGADRFAGRSATDGLVRLSVGIEDVRDLIEDLRQALEVGQPARESGPALVTAG